MLTCCPVVVRPPFVWPRVSLPSCLSFALQLALVMQVPVGSLLPYGSQSSRWGHPCGVEAGLSLIRTKVWYVFSFPFGLFLRVVTALRDMVTIWVNCVGRFPLIRDQRLSLVLRPFSFWMGFELPSEASLSALSLQARFLVVLAETESLWLFLALSSFFPVRCYGHMSTSMTLAPGLRLSLVPYSRSFRMGLEPLSEASLRALHLPARSFLVVLAEAASIGSSWISPLFFLGQRYGSKATCIALDPVRRLSLVLGPISFWMGFDPLSEDSLRAL